jgi:hypothetical protein
MHGHAGAVKAVGRSIDRVHAGQGAVLGVEFLQGGQRGLDPHHAVIRRELVHAGGPDMHDRGADGVDQRLDPRAHRLGEPGGVGGKVRVPVEHDQHRDHRVGLGLLELLDGDHARVELGLELVRGGADHGPGTHDPAGDIGVHFAGGADRTDGHDARARDRVGVRVWAERGEEGGAAERAEQAHAGGLKGRTGLLRQRAVKGDEHAPGVGACGQVRDGLAGLGPVHGRDAVDQAVAPADAGRTGGVLSVRADG